jgi:hypothetical protein
MEPRLSKTLQEANNYLERHKIEKLVSEVLNKTVQSRDKEPVIRMIKVLASLTSPEVLFENGIRIEKD